MNNLSIGLALMLLVAAAGCASPEAAQVKAFAATEQTCGEHEVSAGIARETDQVREWIVGCNFTYMRVHCSEQGCVRAPPKPTCLGGDVCLVENPQTLEWELPTHAQR